jgi:ABC-type multidrug transport system fused ATPase/permease subunit
LVVVTIVMVVVAIVMTVVTIVMAVVSKWVVTIVMTVVTIVMTVVTMVIAIVTIVSQRQNKEFFYLPDEYWAIAFLGYLCRTREKRWKHQTQGARFRHECLSRQARKQQQNYTQRSKIKRID